MPETNARIKVCHDTAANFKTNNPTLLVGEWALETDTKKMKIGDGSAAYNALPYSTAEDSDEWRKPDDWIDIRSGAIPESVYFLVGHSADYSKYPKFAVYATVSSSGTYDVYVDGIKQATTASGSSTELDWQTLALTSGWDVTYPSALRAHIVRVTPSSDANKFTAVRCNNPEGMGTSSANEPQFGVLWCHYAIDYVINASYSFASYPWGYWNPDLIAVTAQGNVLKVSNLYNFLGKGVDVSNRGPANIEYLPVFDLNNSSSLNANGAFCCNSLGTSNTKLKKIHLKNGVMVGAGKPFGYMDNLTEIVCEQASILVNGETFYQLPKLDKLPPIQFFTGYGAPLSNSLVGLSALEDTFLDVSYHTTMTRLVIGASSSYPIYGIKGLTVSSSAPFSGSSPQLDAQYTGLSRAALVNLFNSMPTVTSDQVCNVTGCSGASDLTADDIAIAVNKGWTVTR